MVVLLVTLAVMSVAIGAAMPMWRTVVQRDREEELIFRGRQYTRAIGLFQRRFANAYPPSFDVLVEQKFLRKKFKDPMTESGEFQILYQGSALTLPGGRGTGSPATGQQPGGSGTGFGTGSGRSQSAFTSTFTTGGRGSAGPLGGVIGVVSTSKDKSFRILDGRSQYNEWRFIWLPTAQPGRGGGANQPGGRGGRGGQGGNGFPGVGSGPGRGPGSGSSGPFGSPGQNPGGGGPPGRGRGPG